MRMFVATGLTLSLGEPSRLTVPRNPGMLPFQRLQIFPASKYVALLASALTTREAARLLEVSESRIRQRLSEGTLYGVKAGRENRLPAFQFEGGGEVPGIAEVLTRMDRSVHPVAVLNWFALPNPDLYLDEGEARPVSPRHWLLSGGDPEIPGRLVEEL